MLQFSSIKDVKAVVIKMAKGAYDKLVAPPTKDFFFKLTDGVYKFVPISDVRELPDNGKAYSKQIVFDAAVFELNGAKHTEKPIVTLLASIVKEAVDNAKTTIKLYKDGALNVKEFNFEVKNGRMSVAV